VKHITFRIIVKALESASPGESALFDRHGNGPIPVRSTQESQESAARFLRVFGKLKFSAMGMSKVIKTRFHDDDAGSVGCLGQTSAA
jgi:hypothetical protein